MYGNRGVIPKFVAVMVAALMLAVCVAPAFADETPVPVIASGVFVAGRDLSGLTAADAASVLSTVTLPAFAPLPVDATGTVAVLSGGIRLDVASLVADALAATSPVTIDARYAVDSTAVASFVNSLAARVRILPVDAKRSVVKRRLRVAASRTGRALDIAASKAAITSALTAEIAAGGSQQATVTVPVVVVNPKVTIANMGKTIIVVLGERRLYLYARNKLEKSYICAIGMLGHATPSGTWKVVAKNPHPAWRNPGSDWARNMPRYIAPGYSNPLGLRALYLNASGIRIHGTSKTYSMGRAASHGCIRLTNKNIVDLYPRVPVGTTVFIVK